MFTDLALSRDIMREYLSKEVTDHSSQSLSVMVLQQSVWPFSSRKKDVDLPPSVSYYRSSKRGALTIGLTDARSTDILCGFL
jgi:hypothetical protein